VDRFCGLPLVDTPETLPYEMKEVIMHVDKALAWEPICGFRERPEWMWKLIMAMPYERQGDVFSN